MVDHFFVDLLALRRLRTGPLGEHIDRFAALLSERGYARQTAKVQIRLVADLSHWLQRRRLGVGDLDEQRVLRFLRHKRRDGRVYPGEAATLRVFLEQLRHTGVIPIVVSEGDKPVLRPIECAFAQYLSQERGLSQATSRNYLPLVRRFLSDRFGTGPSALIQRVLAMPSKRPDCTPIEFLTRPEIDALLAAPDQTTWAGRRDRTLLLVAVQTGLRVSELTGLRCQDAVLGNGAHVRCRGKGRKERCTPLRKETVAALRAWLKERRGGDADPLFPNARGHSLSRDGVEYLLAKHVTAARKNCSSLQKKRVSPHMLRHSTAMDLLQHGVDRTVIALWLGHETVDTVQVYLHANLAMKEQALAKTLPLGVKPGCYRPDDQLLAFLKSL